ncbi:hypothetical protein DM01DRAFT_1334824 [Hesseltinella vesiculosa]|uniref:Uncharacterized protein n=1 Tax=Hesseltinella vesiculosa TaxID=101127 RepID=A0A1X2GLE7_9FUNG|nr:hypothetical protein DM01DRAFT_1334824 [Hesseltinella vesiculosa]
MNSSKPNARFSQPSRLRKRSMEMIAPSPTYHSVGFDSSLRSSKQDLAHPSFDHLAPSRHWQQDIDTTTGQNDDEWNSSSSSASSHSHAFGRPDLLHSPATARQLPSGRERPYQTNKWEAPSDWDRHSFKSDPVAEASTSWSNYCMDGASHRPSGQRSLAMGSNRKERPASGWQASSPSHTPNSFWLDMPRQQSSQTQSMGDRRDVELLRPPESTSSISTPPSNRTTFSRRVVPSYLPSPQSPHHQASSYGRSTTSSSPSFSEATRPSMPSAHARPPPEPSSSSEATLTWSKVAQTGLASTSSAVSRQKQPQQKQPQEPQPQEPQPQQSPSSSKPKSTPGEPLYAPWSLQEETSPSPRSSNMEDEENSTAPLSPSAVAEEAAEVINDPKRPVKDIAWWRGSKKDMAPVVLPKTREDIDQHLYPFHPIAWAKLPSSASTSSPGPSTAADPQTHTYLYTHPRYFKSYEPQWTPAKRLKSLLKNTHV